jgi:hypothetical protein
MCLLLGRLRPSLHRILQLTSCFGFTSGADVTRLRLIGTLSRLITFAFMARAEWNSSRENHVNMTNNSGGLFYWVIWNVSHVEVINI